MSDRDYANQLRQPIGDSGHMVAKKMNADNYLINIGTINAIVFKPHDNVLEIGMGNGFFLKNIFEKESTVTYTGCDISEIMVKEAQINNHELQNSGKASFINADVESLPLQSNTFDIVFSVHCIYFWDKPERVFKELQRVLKPNGQLTISIRPKYVMEFYHYTNYGFTLYDKESITNTLEANHFKIIEIVENNEYTKKICDEEMIISNLIVSAIKQSIN